MKPLSQSPRAQTPLPLGEAPGTESTVTATPDTRPLADVDADLGFDNEQRLAHFIKRINDLDCEHGPDQMRVDIDAVLVDIRSEPEAGVSTLLLHLIAKLDDWTSSLNPHISVIAVQRFHACSDLFAACSESFGAPPLQELVQARERSNEQPWRKGLQPYHLDLHARLKEIAQPIIEARIAALGLPSNHDGTDFDREYAVLEPQTSFDDEDCNPWQIELLQISRAISAFDLPSVSLNETLNELFSQAEAGVGSQAPGYDLACLNDFRYRPRHITPPFMHRGEAFAKS